MESWRPSLTALCVVALCALGPGTAAAPRQAATPPGAPPLPSDRASVEAMLSKAEALPPDRKVGEALPLFERALEGARQLRLESLEGRALSGIGEVFFATTQYAATRERGLRALEIFERLGVEEGVGRAANLLSMAEGMSGNFAAARTYAERAIAAYESAGHRRGRALSTLQSLRYSILDLDAQRTLYDRVLDDARAVGDLGIEGRALHSLGDHLFTAGLYEEALDRLTKAAAVFEQLDAIASLGTVNNSLGRVYRAHGRLNEALAFQLKALGLHQKTNAPFELLQSLNAVATVYQRMGALADARRYYERALVLAEASSSQRVQDLVRANLGTLLLDQGQFARGAGALEQVIANGLDGYPGRRYAWLSFAYAKMARPLEALDAANKAVERCIGDEDSCIDALRRRASAHSAMGNPQGALADVNAALTNLEAVRARLVPTDFFKQDFHYAQESVYSLAIALQVREKQDRLALETAELARSRAFLDLLASRDVRFKEKDRAQLASLRESGSQQFSRIELAPPAAPRVLPLTLRGAGSVEAAAPSAFVSPSLELRSLVTAAPSAVEDLVATAARLQSTLLVYWVGEDELFIWVVAPDGAVQSRRVGVLRSRLLELIRATSPFGENDNAAPPRRAILTRGSATVELQRASPDVWRELHRLLIDPVRAALPRTTGSLLTIVPQGPLLNVSFAALQNGRGRYLLEDFTLHYAPAGAVLQFTAPKRRADARTGAMLLVADPVPPRLSPLDRPLARLPGARSEAAAISRLVPSDRLTLLQDRTATEALARESASDKAVLHFATHAIVSDEDPFKSFLALGPSTGDGGDGRLTSEEVYGLDLAADLVVLSACRSAGGRVTGDGISAFARAFIYAGTASLVASLWDVADEPTNRLLPDFYRAWWAGDSKGRALRNAQLRLLRDLRAGRVSIQTPAGAVTIPEHPVFWAGFALFGEPD